MSSERRRYYVYVVELASDDGREVYVGSSALPPEQRFRKHTTSRKGSRHVRRRGVRLLPRLYDRMNPLPSREAAKAAEQRLRRDLERAGYRVKGSCSPRENLDCWL